MPHPVIDSATLFRARLLARERAAATQLVQAYGLGFREIQSQFEALSGRLQAQFATTGFAPSRAQLIRLDTMQSLLGQIENQVGRYATFADTLIATSVQAEIQNALLDSRSIVSSFFSPGPGRTALVAAWDILPVEAVNNAIGFTAPGSPLFTRLSSSLGTAVAERVRDGLVTAIIAGDNPKVWAAALRREMGVGLSWSMTTARTAQLWSYREATRSSYLNNSDIVGSWTWFATLDDERTCMSCIAQHGSIHQLTETLNDHQNGRCVQIPNLVSPEKFGLSNPEIPSGESWFESQSPARQLSMMGPGKYDAWQKGLFNFNDLSQPYVDPVYGDMVTEATLGQLIGNR